MAGAFARSDPRTGFSPPSRKRRLYVTNVDVDRIKQESAHLDAMGPFSSPTTRNGTPLLERLLQLEQHMDVLEQKCCPSGLTAGLRSSSLPSSFFDSPAVPSSLERRCRCVKYVLLETEAKGTLVERIQRLEKRISQHSLDLEEALTSERCSSGQSEPRHGEYPAHLESPSHNDSRGADQETGSSQETYGNNLEMLPAPNPPSETHGSSAESKEPTEDAATRESGSKLEHRPSSSSPAVEAQTETIPERSARATERFEAESLGKTTNDKNIVRILKFEETSASRTSTSTDSESMNVPAETAGTGHVAERNDGDETSEQPSVGLIQNEYHVKRDGKLAKNLIHFRSLDEPLGKIQTDVVEESSPLPRKGEDDKPNEQSESLASVTAQVPDYAIPFLKKEMKRKQSFTQIRERIQRFFGLKEPDRSAMKDTTRPHASGSKESDSATKGALSRPHRFGSRETASAARSTSRLHRFGSKETNPTAKLGKSRSHRYGFKEIGSSTRVISGPQRFGSSTL